MNYLYSFRILLTRYGCRLAVNPGPRVWVTQVSRRADKAKKLALPLIEWVDSLRRMRDKDLYTRILGINPPWKVTDVDLSVDSGEVKIFIEQRSGTVHQCPGCGVESPGYDRRQRSWRHLDTCQLKTILVAEVPRISCPEHGASTVV